MKFYTVFYVFQHHLRSLAPAFSRINAWITAVPFHLLLHCAEKYLVFHFISPYVSKINRLKNDDLIDHIPNRRFPVHTFQHTF